MEYCKEAKNKCARATCVNRTSFLRSTENENKLPKDMYKLCHRYILKYANLGLSWWSSELPMQGAQVRSLVRELDPLYCKSEPQ